jgi:2-methylcitrate dehydratase PrpD
MVDGRKIPAANAAYIHAQLSNVLDADETLHNRSHIGSAQVATAIAIGEALGSSGRDVIAAVAAGFDVAARVGHSLMQYVPDESGKLVFAPVVGFSWVSFGTAAVTGRLMGLDAEAIARAFGQALVMSPVAFDAVRANAPCFTRGVPANWHKYQMTGPSAEAGILAAQLASDGWVACADIFDDGSEFWRSFGSLGCDYDFMYRDLGRRWLITETSYKLYPFCRYGAGPIDLFGRLVRENDLAVEDIEEVLIRVAPVELTRLLANNGQVDEDIKTVYDLPMALGRVAVGMPPGPAWFDPNPVDERIRIIASKVRAEVATEWGTILADQMAQEGSFRRLPAEVVLRTSRGIFSMSSEYTQGDPWDPSKVMSDATLAQKVRDYTSPYLSDAGIESLIQAVFNLDSTADLGVVIKAMTQRR